MSRSMLSMSRSIARSGAGMFSIATVCLCSVLSTTQAESIAATPKYSPVVNINAVRGLSAIASAESMGEGRVTFNFTPTWYTQKIAYFNTPNVDALIFTGTGAFSYGVNSNVDLFASVSGFGGSNYTSTSKNSGLGTINAGVQGSLPFPKYSFISMGGQAAIIGGLSPNQINTNRADGYNYFETRTGFDFRGKLMQSFVAGTEDYGIKLHLNEAGVVGINENNPALIMLGAGLQANIGVIVLGAEFNGRTQFANMAFETDPLWVTPSILVRTPYSTSAMLGVDISLSADRTGGQPRALEPYRIFGSVAFSFDVLAEKRHAEYERKRAAEMEKGALAYKAAESAKQVESLTAQSVEDSIALVSGSVERDAMQRKSDSTAQSNKIVADAYVTKAGADSIALSRASAELAIEKEKRSEAEKQLLSTGALLLDAVYFESGKTIISINSKPYLNIIGTMLLKYPKLRIEVSGHTDNLGSKAFNLELSKGRAQAVRDYLIEYAPALNATLSAQGYGMSMPKADNKTEEGRLTNRRVELRVINKEILKDYAQK